MGAIADRRDFDPTGGYSLQSVLLCRVLCAVFGHLHLCSDGRAEPGQEACAAGPKGRSRGDRNVRSVFTKPALLHSVSPAAAILYVCCMVITKRLARAYTIVVTL